MIIPNDFFELPTNIYKDDLFYFGESKEFINSLIKNHQEKANIHIELNKSSRAVGFIYNDSPKEESKVAYFGFFETLNDSEGCKELFQNLEKWAKKHNATKLIGPIDFSTFFRYRIRLNHFENTPFTGEPYNKSYYPALLEENGYSHQQLYRTYKNHNLTDEFHNYIAKKDSQIKQSNELSEFKVIPLTEELWMKYLPHFFTFIDGAFKLNHYYYPIDQDFFFKVYGHNFAKRLCPKTSKIVLDPENNIAAFMANFPDYSEIIFDQPDYSYEKDYKNIKLRSLLIKSVGVHPKYRSMNLFNYMLADMPKIIARNYSEVRACLVQVGGITEKYTSTFHSKNPTEYAVFAKNLNEKE